MPDVANDFIMDIPDPVYELISALEKAEFDAYLVGGCVRDAMLGIKPHDYDICTSARPEEIKKVFNENGLKTYDTGIKHGTVSVVNEANAYEVTTFRKESNYTDMRHPDRVEFVNNIVDDLSRRDFTMNAMAYNPKTGLIDPFNGTSDLANKTIRCVGIPKERFKEDALRMFRAIRFAAINNFTIEQETKKAIEENKDLIKNISQERKTSEFNKTLTRGNPKFLDDYGDFIVNTFPEFTIAKTVSFKSIEALANLVKVLAKLPQKLSVKLAALLQNTCDLYSSYNSTHTPKQIQINKLFVERTMRDMKYDSKTIKQVTDILECHDKPIYKNDISLKCAMNKIGIEGTKDLTQILIAETSVQKEELESLNKEQIYSEEIEELNEKIEQLQSITPKINRIIKNKECYQIKDLAINGEDLISVNIYGKNIGDMLNEMLRDVMKYPDHNNKEYLINKVIEINQTRESELLRVAEA